MSGDSARQPYPSLAVFWPFGLCSSAGRFLTGLVRVLERILSTVNPPARRTAVLVALVAAAGVTAVAITGWKLRSDREQARAEVSVAAEEVDIGGIRFVGAPPDTRAECGKAARALPFPVLCPAVLPADWQPVGDCAPCNGMFSLTGYFTGPWVSSESGEGVGHLSVWASPPEGITELYVGCPDGTALGREERNGLRADWISCSAGSTLDSGHLILQWSQGDIVYAVSLHGEDSTLARRALRLLAEHLIQLDD